MSERRSDQSIGLKNRFDNNLKLSIPKPSLNFNVRNYPSTAPAVDNSRPDQLGDLAMVRKLIRNLEHVDDNQEYYNSPLSPSSSPAASVIKRK